MGTKKKCSGGKSPMLVPVTMSVHELLEMLGATRPIIVVDHDGQLQGVINQPITKREVQLRPPAPHKYVKDEIAICEVIQRCELIPGVIRQKLIAAIIDLANSPISRVKFSLRIGERNINNAFQWTFNPFGAYGPEIWAAVSSSLHGGPWRGHYDAWILNYRKSA